MDNEKKPINLHDENTMFIIMQVYLTIKQWVSQWNIVAFEINVNISSNI